jgi:aminobenzoyl-glutamate utilization protein B
LDSTGSILPLQSVDSNTPSAATDVGDVSWNVPTIGFGAATFVPGVAAHSWQATVFAGMSIGQRGMLIAAKALAFTATDLFENARIVEGAKTDFAKEMSGKPYSSQILVNQKAPLDYRKN